MAIENELDVRLQHAVIGSVTTVNSQPKEGEIVFNSTLDNFRVGTTDSTAYGSLPNLIPHGFYSGTDVSSETSDIPTISNYKVKIGDYYLNTSDYHLWQCISVDTTSDTIRWSDLGTLKGPKGDDGTDEKVKQSNISSNTAYPLLVSAQSSPTSGTSYGARFSTKLTASQDSIVIYGYDNLSRMEITGDRPFRLQSRNSTSGSWSDIDNRIIYSKGMINAPTGDSGDVKYLKATIGSDNAVTWGWGTPSGGGSDYKTSLNGSDYPSSPASGAISLGSWYAPTSGGTSANQLLLSQGSGNPFVASAPAWTNFSFPSSGTTKTLNYVGGTGWTLQDFPIYTFSSPTGTSGLVPGFTLPNPLSDNATDYFLNANGTWSYPSDLNFSKGYINNGGNYIVSSTISSYIPARTPVHNYFGFIQEDGITITNFSASAEYISGALVEGVKLKLKLASTSEIGGIKVASNTASSAGSIASSGTYYPIEITAAGEACVKVPSGGGGTDTWRNVQVNGTQILNTSTSTGALNLVAGNGISLTSNNGSVTISNNNVFHPIHLDAWIGRTNNNAYSIDTMDAPFYCTDLRSPTYTNGNYNAFPGESSQWGVYDTVNLPEHITLWPCGIHNLNKSYSSNSDNWMAVMMTSWAAGHPMSISIVNNKNKIREWIPLIYTGPLEISGRIYSVSIDLGAAIILHLLNTAAYFPFEDNQQSEPNIYSLTNNFAFNYSIGTTPITFRWFNTTNSNGCPNVFRNQVGSLMDVINVTIKNLKINNFNGFIKVENTSIIEEVWNNEKIHAEDDGTRGTIAGNGSIFMTWDEILDTRDQEQNLLYTNGVFVCTALPEIHAIQQI